MNKKIIASVLAVAFAFSMVGSAGAVTLEELQTQFNDLLAQYNLLLAQVGQPTGATAVCFNTDLSKGMTSNDVKNLQIVLNKNASTQVASSGAGSPGNETTYFGSLTLAAVKNFQSSEGIINTGYVGPLTRGALNALYCTPVVPPVTYPAGCTSAVGFSPTTGDPCSGTPVTYPAGCTSAVGFSPTTGDPCSGTTTTTVGPSYGTLSQISYPVSNPQTNLYGGSTYELLASQYKATGSDITLKKIAIQMVDVDSTTFPWQVFSTISVWDGSTKLAEVIPTEANMIKNTFAHDYTLDISGFNYVVSKDTQKVLTVKGTIVASPVAAVTSVVSPQNYDLTLLKGSVVYSDTAGVTYTSASGNDVTANNFSILASQAAGKIISLATDNPLAGNVVISSSGTTKADVLKFNVKITDINTTFSSGVIGITVDGTKVTPAMITSLELWDGSSLVTSAAPGTWSATTSTISWTNFTLPVSSGATKNFTVKAVIAQVASTYINDGSGYLQITTGPKLIGIDANSNVVTADGSTSVTGSKLYPFLSAPTFTFVSQSVTVKNSSDTKLSDIGDTAITFSVTAGGVNDIYIPMAKAATVTLGMSETLNGSATATTATTWSCNSPATEDPFAAEFLYRISSGQTANCTFSALVDNTIASSTSAYMSVALTGVKWYDSATSTAPSFISQAWGFTNIKTADFYLTATNP